jgi:hypothetical protein
MFNETLSRFGQTFTGMGGKMKEYGAAGVVSVVVESVLYWALILFPASAYMYHNGAGAGSWLPTPSDPDAVAEFGKLLASAYIFSKIPPIEAGRWAWAIAMIPWFQDRLPSSWTSAENVSGSLDLDGA